MPGGRPQGARRRGWRAEKNGGLGEEGKGFRQAEEFPAERAGGPGVGVETVPAGKQSLDQDVVGNGRMHPVGGCR